MIPPLISLPSSLLRSPSLSPQDFESLLRDEWQADFQIRLRVEEDETEHNIRCHRAFLAARSPFFAVALRSGMKESLTGILTIPGPSQPSGLSVTALRALLVYFYTGRVDHIKSLNDCLYILGAAGSISVSVNPPVSIPS